MSGALRRIGLGALTSGLVVGSGLYLAAPHPPRTPSRVRDVADLERFLHRLVASGRPPGLSIVVVKDGRLAYRHAVGMADGPRGIAATPDTVYHWWSMTKIPTAIAVLQLAEQGRLRLDAPIQDYLPWFAVESPSPSSPALTPRHLLNHSSGLPDTVPAIFGWVHYDDEGRNQTALTRQYLPRFKRLRFAPGSDAAYSNFNYMVLGAVIEAASGQSYESYVREHLLRPLRMERTDFVCTPPLEAHRAAGTLPVVHVYTPLLPFLLDVRALVRERQGRLLWLQRMYLDTTPPSGLMGSAADAARLVLAYLSEGEIEGARVLSAAAVRRMTYEDRVGRRGLGWAVGPRRGRLFLQHPGGGPGFATLMRLYPEEHLGFVVMANGTDLDYDGLGDLLASMEW